MKLMWLCWPPFMAAAVAASASSNLLHNSQSTTQALLVAQTSTAISAVSPLRDVVERPSKPDQAAAKSAIAGPNLSAWRADGRPGVVRRPPTHAKQTTQAAHITHITPLLGDAPSVKASGIGPRWCGVRLQTGTSSAQSLVLVGVGVTEALSCDGIKAFGAVPAPRGVARIAFVYRGSSPNASGVNTIVIIDSAEDSVGWAINDDLSYKLDQLGTLTSIPAIRTYLAKNSQRW